MNGARALARTLDRLAAAAGRSGPVLLAGERLDDLLGAPERAVAGFSPRPQARLDTLLGAALPADAPAGAAAAPSRPALRPRAASPTAPTRATVPIPVVRIARDLPAGPAPTHGAAQGPAPRPGGRADVPARSSAPSVAANPAPRATGHLLPPDAEALAALAPLLWSPLAAGQRPTPSRAELLAWSAPRGRSDASTRRAPTPTPTPTPVSPAAAAPIAPVAVPAAAAAHAAGAAPAPGGRARRSGLAELVQRWQGSAPAADRGAIAADRTVAGAGASDGDARVASATHATTRDVSPSGDWSADPLAPASAPPAPVAAAPVDVGSWAPPAPPLDQELITRLLERALVDEVRRQGLEVDEA